MLQKQRYELPLRGEGGHSSELEKIYYSQLSKTQVNLAKASYLVIEPKKERLHKEHLSGVATIPPLQG